MLHLPLRTTLWLDATASGTTGLLGLGLAGPLAEWTDLPVGLLRGAGVALIPFVAFLAILATRDGVNRTWVKVAIAVNLAWVVASAGVLLSGAVEPNALGYAFVIAQAVAVALFAEIQVTALDQNQAHQAQHATA